MKLSNYFTLDEMFYSTTAVRKGIDNEPGGGIVVSLTRLCQDILDKIREKLGVPVIVSSGYRSVELNKVLGGSPTSQHCSGEAADLIVRQCSKRDLFNTVVELIRSNDITVGQLIWEYGDDDNPDWVHVSLPYKHVNQILRAVKVGNKTNYIDITDKYL